MTTCLLGPLMVLINGLHWSVCLHHGGSHRGHWFARLHFGGQMVVAMHGLLGNLKRRLLVGSTVITGFAATFGEQMMVTVNCQLTVVVAVYFFFFDFISFLIVQLQRG